MTCRTLSREFLSYPATVLLCVSWIAVFAAMVSVKLAEGPAVEPLQVLLSGIGEVDRFGDLTLRALSQGEYWRLMTCNFIHYSILHLALNLIAFYILGTMVESWYGSPQLLMIFGLTGFLGNAISSLIRRSVGSSPLVHSAGGSVVIMGLIGLCAVVGWRSRTARERELLWPMIKALVLTLSLGIAFPRYIDNWGHAGGVLVGLPLGFLDRPFLRRRGRPQSWGPGLVVAVLIVGCWVAQVVAERNAAAARAEQSLRTRLAMAESCVRATRLAAALQRSGTNPELLLLLLERLAEQAAGDAARGELMRLRSLAQLARSRELSDQENQEFQQRMEIVARRFRRDFEELSRDYWNHRLRRFMEGARAGPQA
jgi:rhomboid protease GluP